ncbi:MAG: hypothetical protein QNJ37_17740 [Crocosphaera sp.]|nr:hypothetical protein [Crocosphaera sp.]
MEPISLILSALVAGAAKTADNVTQDIYNALKALIKQKFENKGKADSVMILDKYEKKPEKTKPLLEDELGEVEADKDKEIIELAEKLLEQLNSKEAAQGKSNISIYGGTVQGLTQQNTGTINQNFN